MTWTRLFWQDLRFQWRHGFYGAYVLVSAIYIVFLRQLSGPWQELAGIAVLFSDPAGLGFFFVGGIFLLERGDSLHGALFTAPVTVRHYLLAKVGSLAVLSVAAGGAIVHWGLNITIAWLPLLLGLTLGSMLFTLLGIAAAVRCETVNQYMLVSLLFSPLFLPVAEVFGVAGGQWFWWLFPSKGMLLLLESGVKGQGVPWLAVAASCIWLVLVSYWTATWFRRFVLEDAGWAG